MTNSTFFGLDWDPPLEVELSIIAGMTILAGLMSGLTLCLFSMDIGRLTALAHGPNTKDARRSNRVLMLLHKPHWLLVTLLLLDAIAVEVMPLIFNMFLPPVAAVFTSVGLILVFGEILPQSTFVRYALPVSAALVYPVLFLMCLTSPISWTTGKLLDLVVGNKETVFFRRRELREIIRIQEELRMENVHQHQLLPTGSSDEDSMGTSQIDDAAEDRKRAGRGAPTSEEVNIMLGALSLSENTAKDVMGRTTDTVFKMHIDERITRDTTQYVFHSGTKWVGVYEDIKRPNNITHVFTPRLLLLFIYKSEEQAPRVRDLPIQRLHRCMANSPCNEVFEELQEYQPSVMAVTEVDEMGIDSVIGVISLADILETMYKVTFSSEMDPRNASPMQVVMQTWEREEARRMVIAHYAEEEGRMSGRPATSTPSSHHERTLSRGRAHISREGSFTLNASQRAYTDHSPSSSVSRRHIQPESATSSKRSLAQGDRVQCPQTSMTYQDPLNHQRNA